MQYDYAHMLEYHVLDTDFTHIVQLEVLHLFDCLYHLVSFCFTNLSLFTTQWMSSYIVKFGNYIGARAAAAAAFSKSPTHSATW